MAWQIIIIHLLYITALLYASIIDYNKQIVNNKVLIAIIILYFFSIFFNLRLVHNIVPALILGIIVLIFSAYTNSMGGGDVKFIFVNCLYHGFFNSINALIIGFTILCFYIMVLRKKEGSIALVPFLSAGYTFILFRNLILN